MTRSARYPAPVYRILHQLSEAKPATLERLGKASARVGFHRDPMSTHAPNATATAKGVLFQAVKDRPYLTPDGLRPLGTGDTSKVIHAYSDVTYRVHKATKGRCPTDRGRGGASPIGWPRQVNIPPAGAILAIVYREHLTDQDYGLLIAPWESVMGKIR